MLPLRLRTDARCMNAPRSAGGRFLVDDPSVNMAKPVPDAKRDT